MTQPARWENETGPSRGDAHPADKRQPPSRRHVLIVGGGRVGMATAEYLVGSLAEVTFVGDASDSHTEESDVSTISQVPADVADVEEIRDSIGAVDLVVTVGSDSRSLFLGHLCELTFDPVVTVATLEDPDRREAYHETGLEPVSVPELLAERISHYVGGVEDHESLPKRT
jgi:Trk K+ transport system NAD-binding subunit